jgi:hypothetical protein
VPAWGGEGGGGQGLYYLGGGSASSSIRSSHCFSPLSPSPLPLTLILYPSPVLLHLNSHSSQFTAVLCTYLCAGPMRYCYSKYIYVLSSLYCLLARHCFFRAFILFTVSLSLDLAVACLSSIASLTSSNLLYRSMPYCSVSLIQCFPNVFKSTVS